MNLKSYYLRIDTQWSQDMQTLCTKDFVYIMSCSLWADFKQSKQNRWVVGSQKHFSQGKLTANCNSIIVLKPLEIPSSTTDRVA
jgi:hypothetical protein